MTAAVLLELPATPSFALQAGFIAMAIVMTGFLGWWSRRPLIPAAWLVVTGGLALGGVLRIITLPPFFLVLFAGGFIGAVVWHKRGSWRDLPLRALVGFQAFRIVVELLIHQAVAEGVAPEQLTWTGRNFDMIAGVTALALFPFVDRVPRWVLSAWNLLGAGLLLNVVVVAILSLPLPFQQFHPVNAWVGFFPFAWLPLVAVMIAAIGHVALLRRLRADAAGPTHG